MRRMMIEKWNISYCVSTYKLPICSR